MEAEKNAAESASIITAIRNVADHSDILSINASIGAARVGSVGKGFAVVAEEVRKMASESENLSGQIEKKLESIHLSAKQITGAIQETTTLSNEQNDAINQLKEELSHVNHMYKELITMTASSI
jgi:methyl-accepting chemotaxis protein